MKLIRLQEQIAENTCIHQDIAQDIIPHHYCPVKVDK